MGGTDDGVKDRVTLQTIADQLGLSRTTISNAYGRPDQLTPELREKILKTAKLLGYSGPNAAARTLRSGRSGSVGLLVNDTLSYTITDPAAVLMIQGFAQVFDERGLSLVTLPAPIDLDAGVEAARSAVMDSCLVFCAGPDDRRLRAILDRGIPVVTVDSPRIPAAAYVGIDDRGGARSIAEYVIRLGHRKIGVMTLPLKHDGRDGFVDEKRLKMVGEHLTVSRLQGYQDAVMDAGMAWSEVTIYECSVNTKAAGESAAAALLDRADRPSVILAQSDLLALGAYRAAAQRGLRIPRDLSITGFDDIPDAPYSNPPLTTVRQPLKEKGVIAARTVVDGWETEIPPVTVLSTELVVRASTAPIESSTMSIS